MPPARTIAERLEHQPVLRLGVYYAVLLGAGIGLFTAFPWLPQALHPVADQGTGEAARRGIPLGLGGSDTLLSESLAIEAALAISAAFLLALPSAWVYQLTRAKKGYQQSVVQSLILLPVLVAGVVVIVKGSLALAFGLAGIVAAVRFKNSLDDSKDAVYVFLAIAIGLAAGVELLVALTISGLFNVVTLLLWHTDFGRSPANLEGKRAEERMRKAQALHNRTGAFVAMLDEEVLKEMSPEQLDVLADRAWRRRKKAEPDLQTDERPAFSTLLRVHTDDVDGARASVEQVLVDSKLKAWRFGAIVRDGEHRVVEYSLQLRKDQTHGDLEAKLHAIDKARVTRVELR
ncbi:MAG: DUF4956 domain-containing protein [Gemmatimonadales bacterium]|nr:DUF4956 domain-containing protein [Gemmatimonadales bacterium]